MTQPTAFLNVERSLSGRLWVDRLDLAGQRMSGAISQQTGLSDVLSRILAARHITAEEAETYLNPTLRDLMPDPSTLQQCDELAELLANAIIARKNIALFGDYDVDGASSCALVARYLRHFGLEPNIHIPDRITEGYGPNIPAIDALNAAGADLLITLDCGVTSFEALSHAVKIGLPTLVIDHHQVDDELPPAGAIVNPNRQDDISGLGYLCAAGVAFMVLVATNRILRNQHNTAGPDLMQMLDLVALATVCDVVPLKALNRAFVVRGLTQIQSGENVGLRSLSLAARQTGPVTTYSLGFMLGPRINAGGRIGDAALGVSLLTTEDETEAQTIAAQLEELNAERQTIEAQAVEEAIATADAEIGEGIGPQVLVLASESWHPGIVGLVASRLKDRFHRPAFAIAIRRDGTGVGSGRSVSGVDLGRAVHAAADSEIIIKGGGHAMAAGVTLSQTQVARFRAFMCDKLGADVEKAWETRIVHIDAALTARAANLEFVSDMSRAGPFGPANPTPIFAFPAHRITHAQIVGKGGHVKLTIASQDGAKLEGIAFRAAQSELGQVLLNADKQDKFHFCGTLSINHWQGRQSVQLRVEDVATLPR